VTIVSQSFVHIVIYLIVFCMCKVSVDWDCRVTTSESVFWPKRQKSNRRLKVRVNVREELYNVY
jgi:hypothetical protein